MSRKKTEAIVPPPPLITSPVEAPEVSPTPVKDMMIKSGLKSEVVPEAAPKVQGEITIVNLKDVVSINGRQYGPGKGIEVPTDAFQLWRHALADGKE